MKLEINKPYKNTTITGIGFSQKGNLILKGIYKN